MSSRQPLRTLLDGHHYKQHVDDGALPGCRHGSRRNNCRNGKHNQAPRYGQDPLQGGPGRRKRGRLRCNCGRCDDSCRICPGRVHGRDNGTIFQLLRCYRCDYDKYITDNIPDSDAISMLQDTGEEDRRSPAAEDGKTILMA